MNAHGIARAHWRLSEGANIAADGLRRKVETIAADLGSPSDLRRIEQVLKTDETITTLVNNAGFGGTAPLLDADVDKMQQMVELNVTALMRLTYAAVPDFVKRGGAPSSTSPRSLLSRRNS